MRRLHQNTDFRNKTNKAIAHFYTEALRERVFLFRNWTLIEEGRWIIDTLKPLLALFLGAFCGQVCLGQMRVLVNQVGYEAQESKQAVISSSLHDRPENFVLVDSNAGKIVLKGSLQSLGPVNVWGETVFWIADFSSWKTPGMYTLRVSSSGGDTSSCQFAIEDNVLEHNTLSNVVFYFKGQRASGLFDKADRHLAVPGSPGAFVDVHGGWYDATGDYGIHLSHQNRRRTSIRSRCRWWYGVC